MSRPPAPPVAAAVAAECRRRIAAGSRSFALAAGLLPRRSRNAALVVYAWCRRADDAIDRAPPAARPRALAGLHDELERIARGTATGDPVIDAFGTVASATGMPWHYPREMLAGMRMDLEQAAYDDLGELLHYCYRVAGTVGLMMTHVLTLRDDTALQAAAQLGVAMQLTNICRDVLEDWQLGRLYLPRTWLQRSGLGGLPGQLGGPLPRARRASRCAPWWARCSRLPVASTPARRPGSSPCPGARHCRFAPRAQSTRPSAAASRARDATSAPGARWSRWPAS